MMYSSTLTSSERVILLVWMLKILRLVFSSGSGNSILRSMRPARISAGSRLSIRFVAMITLEDWKILRQRYRAAHLVAEHCLLTSNSKFRHSSVETGYKVTAYKIKSVIKSLF